MFEMINILMSFHICAILNTMGHIIRGYGILHFLVYEATMITKFLDGSSIHVYNVRIENPCQCVFPYITCDFKYSEMKPLIQNKEDIAANSKVYFERSYQGNPKTKIGLDMIMMKVDINRPIDDKKWAGVTNVIVNISSISGMIYYHSPPPPQIIIIHLPLVPCQWIVSALLQIMACRL